jgi:PKHD-type hydroxylase
VRPEEYDGGDLVIEDTYGDAQRQAAGRRPGAVSAAPACTKVTPVTRGERIASFFWIQSLLREGCAAPTDVRTGRVDSQLTQDVPSILHWCS